MISCGSISYTMLWRPVLQLETATAGKEPSRSGLYQRLRRARHRSRQTEIDVRQSICRLQPLATWISHPRVRWSHWLFHLTRYQRWCSVNNGGALLPPSNTRSRRPFDFESTICIINRKSCSTNCTAQQEPPSLVLQWVAQLQYQQQTKLSFLFGNQHQHFEPSEICLKEFPLATLAK